MITVSQKDIYSDENGVLINKENITNPKELEEVASNNSAFFSNALLSLPVLKIKEWSPDFYKQLHKTLFEDIYPWAGEFRKVPVGIEFDHVAYEPWENIESKVLDVFDFINKKNLFTDEREGEKIKNLALVFGTLKNIQPFRDGNTRTALIFTQLLAKQSGLAIDFSLLNKDIFQYAQIQARDGDPTALVIQFSLCTAPSKELPNIHAPTIIANPKEHDNDLKKQIENFEKNQNKSLSPKTDKFKERAIKRIKESKTMGNLK